MVKASKTRLQILKVLTRPASKSTVQSNHKGNWKVHTQVNNVYHVVNTVYLRV